MGALGERPRRWVMSEKETVEEMAARMRVFLPNRQKFPLEELAKYAGKCIAWSPDGTFIVASADDYETLDQLVEAAGYDPSRCVHSYVD
jgi:hypothetical protein